MGFEKRIDEKGNVSLVEIKQMEEVVADYSEDEIELKIKSIKDLLGRWDEYCKERLEGVLKELAELEEMHAFQKDAKE